MEVLESCDKKSEFRCLNGTLRCISRARVMDGINDCLDGSDELAPLTCINKTEHLCSDSGRCILRYRVNDGFADCQNDENLTEFHCIEKLEFTCNNTRCIPRAWVGNGVWDCVSGEDELFNLSVCFENEVQCMDKSRCLPKKYICDGVQNCKDGSDEVELCEDPVMSRCSHSTHQLLPWSILLRDKIDDKHVARFCNDNFQVTNFQLLKGFKCRVKFYSSTFTELEVTRKRRTVPQVYIKNNVSMCSNGADQCFNSKGDFQCARCLDNATIISRSQICDNIVDCPDLSDECLCEDSQAEQLCVHVTSLMLQGYDPLHLACNGRKELADGFDEEFCDYSVTDYTDGSMEMIECAAGQNHNGQVPITTQLCTGEVVCPFKEDECTSACVDESSVERFVTICFPFIKPAFGENRFQFRVNVNDKGEMQLKKDGEERSCEMKIRLLYFGNWNVRYEYTKVEEQQSCSEKFQTGAYDHANIDFVCAIEGVDCPWLFTCMDDKTQISVSKVCDHQMDCTDYSDERYCSEHTHFYCSDGNIIPQNRKQDGNFDCEDRSDECLENDYSSSLQMIKNTFLRYFIAVTAGCTIVANTVAIRMHFQKLRKIKNRKSVKFMNTVLLFNLALADMIMGVVLVIIGIKSIQFSNNYCAFDLKWRTSTLCDVVGWMTVISSQTSVNLLTLMTLIRLFSTFNPYKSNQIHLRLFFFFVFLSWLVSFAFALLPSILDFSQLLWIESNVYFDHNVVQRNKLERYYQRFDLINNIHKSNTAQSKSNPNFVFKRNELSENHTDFDVHGYLASSRQIKILGKLGFYSASAVCFPNLFTENNSYESKYVLSLILYNLLSLAIISFGYILIFRKTRKSKRPAQRNEQKNSRMMFRISVIIATDMICWLPVIIMTILSRIGYNLPGVVNPISTIVLLPINSAINPIIYSKLDSKIKKKVDHILDYITRTYNSIKQRKRPNEVVQIEMNEK